MQWTTSARVNFTDILRAAFTRSQKLLDLTVFFALSVPAYVKGARKHVDEIEPRPPSVYRKFMGTKNDKIYSMSKAYFSFTDYITFVTLVNESL